MSDRSASPRPSHTPPGTPIDVLCAQAGGATKWVVIERGDDSLTCSTGPMAASLPVGAALVAVAHRASSTLEVEATVLDALPGLVRITWPTEGEQRRFARVSCQLPARVCTDDAVLDATVVNVGVGGARLVCAEPLIPGCRVVVALQLPEGEVSAVARVCSREDADPSRYAMRVQFTTVSDRHRFRVGEFVDRLVRPPAFATTRPG